ncbi:neutral/alkaline non-lysosomal ceramidase N-terminal domain-containing protein [Paenibacillus oceani]|uniref:Neutral/alkaline non-lysosomal ceramidase N-terminal domain-containing protein n=1 Tax=Paenibacillus oceani TaxID=2772510 RepID=A0A927H2G0_9BACL|nr:neutral/alkaline non-lysosomal ceramidase N-terminal domain-containing protein [Paenibacillus oceani]MBD2865323.1 neutral/alkaline non-lysosomal ceramidase N-terminal domain-containing protein [Paenibacillus oceani]
MLNAGVARVVINPPLTVPHAGWGAQAHVFPDGIESDLWATVLYVADGTICGLLVDLDFSHFSIEQANAMRSRLERELGFDPSVIRISTTHTHAGPLIHFNYYRELEPVIDDYLAFVQDSVVEAARQARERAVPVRIAAEYGHCAAGYNRRQRLADGKVVTGYSPDGDTDPVLGAVRIVDEAGKPLAQLVHYACHPTTLGPDNRLVSPDYPGVTKRTVEQLVGGYCLFLQGAAGDIGPGPEGFLADYEAVSRIGRTIACEAAKTLMTLEAGQRDFHYERVVESGASLAIWRGEPRMAQTGKLRFFTRTVMLPIKRLMAAAEGRQMFEGYQQKLYEQLRSGASEERIKEATFMVKRSYKVWEQAERYAGQTAIPVETQFMTYGDIAFVSAPLEPFSSTGRWIREQSPFRFTFLSGCSNGLISYLPPQGEYAFGGYEVDTSIFTEGAAEQFAESVVNVLREVAAERSEADAAAP